jgi:signal transduction histidine kinase
MGRMLGLLRETEEKDAAAPQPRLRDLPRLAQQFGDAGLPVELQVDVPGTGISPGIELSVFRIVQEALTNAVKHADATCASVVVTLERDRLLIEVADDGAGSSAQGGGHGLDGMRERVSIFKGTLDTSSREGGGFVVNAELPLGPDAAR